MRSTTSERAGLLALAFLTLAACGSGSGDSVLGETPTEGALIRVVHAAADAPPVDVYVDGVPGPVFTLAYGETSPFAPLPAGMYDFLVYASGADPDVDDPVYTTGQLSLVTDDVVTAVAAGSLSATPGPSEFRVIPLFHDFGDPNPNEARVRVLHAGPDAPAVALDVGDDTIADYLALAPFSDTGSAGLALPADQALQLAILLDPGLERVLGFTIPALPDGGELFVIATGFLGNGPRGTEAFTLLAVGPEGTIGLLPQNPWIYGLHLSPDTGPVDLFVAGSAAPLASGLEFSNLTGPIQVPAGTYSLEVRTPAGALALAFDTPALEAGQAYIAAVTGYSTGRTPGLAPLAIQDALDVDEDAPTAQLRGVHASPDAPPVDLGPLDMMGDVTPLSGWTALTFGDLSMPADGTAVPESPLAIGVAGTGDTMPLLVFDVDLEPTTRAYAFVAGTVDTGTYPGDANVQLVAVETSVWPWISATIQPR